MRFEAGERRFIVLNCFLECDPGEFNCTNGNCVYMEFRCDYFDNCADNSDEEGCSHPPGELCVHLTLTRNCMMSQVVYTVSQKNWGTHIMPHNCKKCGPILIFFHCSIRGSTAEKVILDLPPHLKSDAALPCKK